MRLLLPFLLGVALLALRVVIPAPAEAHGTVFHDRNGNGRRDADEEGIAGVRVSNGRAIVETDAEGRWKLPVGDDTALFVLKPRGWMPPVDGRKLPRFYYLHKPAGSPPLKYPGVKPTGPLPESIDFALRPQKEPEKFRALFFGDPQPRNRKEVDYLAHDVVEELIGFDAAFGLSLGDLVFDDLSVFGDLNAAVSLIGIPWWNVIGNHDQNYDSPDDAHSDETYESVYGPDYFAFDYGPVHFIALDDVEWLGLTKADGKPADSGNYRGALGAAQLEFVKNDLAGVPPEKLVVLLMHIPITAVVDREELYRLIENRPATLSVSAHTHTQEHRFLTKENGWRGAEPHHHVVNVTTCGSWWRGEPDETGIPHATMSDGAPNGYSIVTFDGKKASFEYKAARKPADYQMEIDAPEEIALADAEKTEVVVNVFAGSARSVVEMRLDGRGEWLPMERTLRVDPKYARMKEAEKALGKALRGLPMKEPDKSTHIWRGVLPKVEAAGAHCIEVRTTDVFGHTYVGRRAFRVPS